MKKRSRDPLTPDLTPLIDVIFLLLVFFLVTSVFKKDHTAFLLQLPKVEDGATEKKEELQKYSLEISPNALALNGKELTLEELEATLKKETKKDKPIELRVDKNVIYDRMILILEKIKSLEFHQISLITETQHSSKD